jgi:hypothetical protein
MIAAHRAFLTTENVTARAVVASSKQIAETSGMLSVAKARVCQKENAK